MPGGVLSGLVRCPVAKIEATVPIVPFFSVSLRTADRSTGELIQTTKRAVGKLMGRQNPNLPTLPGEENADD